MKADNPSATAYLIATSTLFVAADPEAGRLIPARAAELSASFVAARSHVARWAQRSLSRKQARPFIAALERLTIPGIQLHYALRKLYLEETARAALSESGGIRQVVVFGAGYDTLALRLHETFPAVQFIETDHPATQRRKTHALAAHNNSRLPRPPQETTPNLHFLPVDLTRQQLAATLANFDNYRADAPTLFIAEGLLMYLSPAEVDKLFHTIREVSSARGSRFAFTFMEPQANGHVNFRTRSRAVDAWLNWRGEVFKWGIERGALPSYLRERGFDAREIATEETLRRRYLEPNALAHLPLATGEYVCVADLDEKTS
ncbi:MAG TPA: SAM-dependent methyltransferase [Pyrinomonadaceae bacterium]|jgi:methyltransferase (TIGR00027 family)|nr:SAM-dependent methyltransferase [Pyrinomonadaceae bacterium]